MDKNKFFLSKDHVNFIYENINNNNIVTIIHKFLIYEYKKHERLLIELSKKEVEILLDELTFLLTSKGIDENSEPNRFGLLIEELIDLFTNQ